MKILKCTNLHLKICNNNLNHKNYLSKLYSNVILLYYEGTTAKNKYDKNTLNNSITICSKKNV